MNWIIVANGVLYFFGALWSLKDGHFIMAGVWLCYGLSAFGLAVVERGIR